ncbi:MAG: hypothetical protein R3362_11255, partial [Rhodothermales bacterium]|nr:hypothetical protein [Rhodothermales bacterium]
DWQDVERPLPERDPSAEVDPLSEALRQIREALGEPPAPPAPEPEPAAPPAATPPPSVATPPLARPPRDREFQGLGAFEHEEHGFGKSNPLSEEAFERRPALGAARRPATTPIRTGAGLPEKVDLERPLEIEQVGRARSGTDATDPLRLLSDPRRAREAFVLKEVLGPPRSRR